MKKPYKPSFNQFFTGLSNQGRKFDYKDGILFVLAFTIVTVVTIFMSAGNPKVYVVKAGEKTIGYINDYDIYEKALESIKKSNMKANLDAISVEKTGNLPDNVKMLGVESIQDAASKALGLNVPSYAVYANGKEIAVLATKAEVDKVLAGVLKYYEPKVENGKITIKSSKIQEKITTRKISCAPSRIQTINDAIKKIVNGKGAQKKYAIKDGDTIWDIALSNGLGVEEIQAANPRMNIDKIKIGQIINLAVNLPYVNVKVVAVIDSKEQIPYETKTVTDKKLRKGLKKLKNRGMNGVAQIKKSVVVENGNVISENVTSSKTLVAARDAVMIIGGKSLMYVATGNFMKPARGRLTSTFGRRWGRMHEGIDLAGPTGTSIKAADSGKVTFVGWSGGYGRCIMISHGNGVQTLYGHTSKTYVKVGQSVEKGQKIAAVGSTGRSTGPHLHFEIRKYGTPVNPLKYIN